LIFST
jgi:hypothetical protein